MEHPLFVQKLLLRWLLEILSLRARFTQSIVTYFPFRALIKLENYDDK